MRGHGVIVGDKRIRFTEIHTDNYKMLKSNSHDIVLFVFVGFLYSVNVYSIWNLSAQHALHGFLVECCSTYIT